MPTEDETTALPHAPPIESSSALHASCPPEEQIEAYAPREERVDSALPESATTPSAAVDERHETRQELPSEPDAQPGAIDASRLEKREHVEDVAQSPSPAGSPEPTSDSDVRLAQSMATAAFGGGPGVGEEAPRYLSYPSLEGRHKVRMGKDGLAEKSRMTG